MPQRPYVITFMALAITFVPVLFFYFLSALVAPCSYLIFRMLTYFDQNYLAQEVVALLYLTIYIGLFYVTSRCTFWASMLASKRTTRIAIQSLILLGLFSCSFLRVIEQSGLRVGMSGTYNFWGACVRYLQTH